MSVADKDIQYRLPCIRKFCHAKDESRLDMEMGRVLAWLSRRQDVGPDLVPDIKDVPKSTLQLNEEASLEQLGDIVACLHHSMKE